MLDAILDFLGLNPEFTKLFLSIFGDWWWLFAPPVLFFFLLDLWVLMKEREFVASVSWSFLEVRLPQDVLKTPKAMEQVFTGLHAIQLPPRWDQTLMFGTVQYWFSFELVGTGGRGLRFFIRTPSQYRNFLESQIYGQYPDAEIVEAEDYVWEVPRKIPNAEYDLWGTEMKLSREDGYPIRSYLDFEATVEEQRIDPMSGLAESMNSLRPGEHLWMQFLLKPTGDKWKDESKEIIDTLMRRTVGKKKGGLGAELSSVMGEVAGTMLGAPPAVKKEVKPDFPPMASLLLSPGEREVVEAVERNTSWVGFETRIRWIYVARRDVFLQGNVSMPFAYFKLFNTLHLNSFTADTKTRTFVRRWLKARREYWRKLRILPAYRQRRFYMWSTFMKKKHSMFTLTSEELAAVYHFPGKIVGAPLMPRVAAKRGGPPTGLPTA